MSDTSDTFTAVPGSGDGRGFDDVVEDIILAASGAAAPDVDDGYTGADVRHASGLLSPDAWNDCLDGVSGPGRQAAARELDRLERAGFPTDEAFSRALRGAVDCPQLPRRR